MKGVEGFRFRRFSFSFREGLAFRFAKASAGLLTSPTTGASLEEPSPGYWLKSLGLQHAALSSLPEITAQNRRHFILDAQNNQRDVGAVTQACDYFDSTLNRLVYWEQGTTLYNQRDHFLQTALTMSNADAVFNEFANKITRNQHFDLSPSIARALATSSMGQAEVESRWAFALTTFHKHRQNPSVFSLKVLSHLNRRLLDNLYITYGISLAQNQLNLT